MTACRSGGLWTQVWRVGKIHPFRGAEDDEFIYHLPRNEEELMIENWCSYVMWHAYVLIFFKYIDAMYVWLEVLRTFVYICGHKLISDIHYLLHAHIKANGNMIFKVRWGKASHGPWPPPVVNLPNSRPWHFSKTSRMQGQRLCCQHLGMNLMMDPSRRRSKMKWLNRLFAGNHFSSIFQNPKWHPTTLSKQLQKSWHPRP